MSIPFRERAFHRWLVGAFPPHRGELLPMGDDVAAVRVGRSILLLTTDALAEGTHFLPGSPAGLVGEAAVGASLSDLASKGGRPVAVLVDLLLPRASDPKWAQEVLLGAERSASRSGCHVVGGDTKSSPARAVVGTVVGEADLLPLPRRDSARPGDVLLHTGTVGRGGAAARALEGRRAPNRAVLAELLAIVPRLAEGRALAPFARAMIDTSDGLADGARRLAEASRVRVTVDVARLPWSPKLARGLGERERLSTALYGGDYELLASVPPARVARALAAVRKAGGSARPIGRVRRGRGAFLLETGGERPMPAAGWDPFAAPRRPVGKPGGRRRAILK